MTSVREVRFALTIGDYEGALRFFRDVLGLQPIEVFDDANGRGVLLRLPAATMELFDHGYAAHIDRVEAGDVLGEIVRVAVHVDALDESSHAALAAGATPMAGAVVTPWGDRNQRLQVAGELQLTLFETADRPTGTGTV